MAVIIFVNEITPARLRNAVNGISPKVSGGNSSSFINLLNYFNSEIILVNTNR